MLSTSPIALTIILSALSLLPIFLLAISAYVKVSVVLQILRNALGLGQIPSSAVISLLAMLLSLHVMSPVLQDTWALAKPQLVKHGLLANNPQLSQANPPATTLVTTPASHDWQKLLSDLYPAKGPLVTFLEKNSDIDKRSRLAALNDINRATPIRTSDKPEASQNDQSEAGSDKYNKEDEAVVLERETIGSLLLAFLISQLHAAFTIGAMIYIPFLAIDLLVANILTGMGMISVSPTSISTPLKLFLFVANDGWYLLCKSLLLSYA